MRPAPYVPRMMRVSPPELAREFPGPHASSNVICAPFLSSSSAAQPPNAPAPTTMTEFREEFANACGPIKSSPAAVEPLHQLATKFPLPRRLGNGLGPILVDGCQYPIQKVRR